MPAAAPTAVEPAPPLRLRFPPALEMTDEQFFQFCRQNRNLRIERTSDGEIIIMAPTSGGTGARNADLTTDLNIWSRKDGTGVAFDSSTGFTLPNGADRAPDAAWVRRERLAKLSDEEKARFLPFCPDFAVELRSPSDRLGDLQEKMQEYLANGLRLGWLIDPQERRVHVYRPGAPVEQHDAPASLDGAPVLPGFTLDLDPIWNPRF